jgi:hypothetical protein
LFIVELKYTIYREKREREREREREITKGFENDVYKENAQIFQLEGHLHKNAFLSKCFLG